MRRKGGYKRLNNQVRFVCVIISISFIIIQIISVLQLGQISMSKVAVASPKQNSNKKFSQEKIGKFGELVIKMLPEDLAFTLFLPSEIAFERDLRLSPTESLVGGKSNDTLAILSRILGFSAVPRTIYSTFLQRGKEIIYDSISGFNLYLLKDFSGKLVVNGVKSDYIDLKLSNILVHVMDGVIMDSEFEESVQPDEEEGN